MPVLVGNKPKPPKKSFELGGAWLLAALGVPAIVVVGGAAIVDWYQNKEYSTPQPIVTQSVPAPSPVISPLVVTLEMRGAVNGQLLTAKGTTNLPDGVVVSINACRYFIDGAGDRRCLGMVKGQGLSQHTAVQNGTFQAVFDMPTQAEVSEGFAKLAAADNEPKFLKGSTEPFVTVNALVTPEFQEGAAAQLIGQKGEMLQGPQSEEAYGLRIVSGGMKVPM